MSDSYNSDVHLSDYWQIVFRKRNIVFFFLLLMIGLTVCVDLWAPPLYRSSTTILLNTPSSRLINVSRNFVGIEKEAPENYRTYLQSQAALIVSRENLSRIIKELNLDEVLFSNKKPGLLSKAISFVSERFPANIPVVSKSVGRVLEDLHKQTGPHQDTPEILMKMIRVDTESQSKVMTLTVKAFAPDLAAKIANKLADVFVRDNLFYVSLSEAIYLAKIEYLQLLSQRAEYALVYKDKHPKLVQIDARISDLSVKINSLSFLSPNSQTPLAGTILMDAQQNNFRVINAAVPVRKPYFPNILLNTFIGIIIGLWGGLLLVFVLHYLEDLVVRPMEVVQNTGWRFLGFIVWPSRGGVPADRYFMVQTLPHSQVAEAYRSLRTSLLMHSQDQNPVQVIHVLGIEENGCADLFAVNLAVSIAQMGRSVLLVDINMRQARLHQIFGFKGDIGLANYLNGEIGLEDIVHETRVPHLYVGCAGTSSLNPSDLLARTQMQDFISKAREKYDYVVLNAAAIILFADVSILAPLTDSMVVVLDDKGVARQVLAAADRKLKETQLKRIAFVINHNNE